MSPGATTPQSPTEVRPSKPRPGLPASAPRRCRASPPPAAPRPTVLGFRKHTAAPDGARSCHQSPPPVLPGSDSQGEKHHPQNLCDKFRAERVRACHREVISESQPGKMGRALLRGKEMPLGSRGHSGSSFAGLTAAPPPAPPPAPYPLQAGACHHLSHQSPARTRGHLTPSLKKRGLLVCTPTKGPAPLRSPPPPTCQLHGGGWRAGEGRGGAGRAGATPVCTESDPYLPQAGQAAPTPGEGEDTGGGGSMGPLGGDSGGPEPPATQAWVGASQLSGVGAERAAGMGKSFRPLHQD